MEDTQPAGREAHEAVAVAVAEQAPRTDPTSAVSDAGGKAVGVLSAAGAQVQERAGAAASAAGQTLDSVMDGVGRLTSQAVDTATSTATDATALAKRTATTVATQAQQTGVEASRAARTTALKVKGVLEAQIEAHPGPVLAGAAVAGFILGRIV